MIPWVFLILTFIIYITLFKLGEIIKEINGVEIKTLRDIKDITYPLEEETVVSVVTDKDSYRITTYFDRDKEKQRIGTNIWQQKCDSDFKKGFKKSRYK